MDDATDIIFILPNGDSIEIDRVDHVPAIGSGILDDDVLYRVVDVVFNNVEANPPTGFGWNVFLQKDDQQSHLLRR